MADSAPWRDMRVQPCHLARPDRKMRMSENTLPANAATIPQTRVTTPVADGGTTFAILVSLSFCHMLNDLNQSLVPALYPILKDSYKLDFAQIGMITLAFQLTASMLQPVVGFVTDKRPQPFSLPIAMSCSLVGLLMLSVANSYPMILLSAALSVLDRRFSTRRRPASRAWRLAAGTVWRNRCSNWAGPPDRRSGHYWRRSSWCRRDRAASPGSRSSRCWR